MLNIVRQRRFLSTFYELFPKTFPKKAPVWNFDQRQLRKEYRNLQAQHHPDMLGGNLSQEVANSGGSYSSLLNKAYHTLKEPLPRSQYMLKVLNNVDLTEEKLSQSIMQSDPSILMQVLDTHEQLEEVQNEEDVRKIDLENRYRIKGIESQLQECYETTDYERAARLTVELKYWVNLANAIKEWQPGKPVTITH
ncbi:hypothetical protein ZYGR_0AY01790 [Zygosaccharomyces rouxii]|uniref:J domain-containing protein n=1 Tax=Zygosaccharomyces rouxii TaxID=4956 RepID=A0A1Q3AJ73_ZYGRO|nr:hypothetical protein ZYGR_0AY01790 [Zygosaccharomyces rouxii]